MKNMVTTEVGDTFEVRDLSLAEEGRNLIEWAELHMPVLRKIRERFIKEKPLQDVRVGCCLHITKETAVLGQTLKAGGAKVFLCASNPLSTTDEVAAALAEEDGIHVYAWKFMDTEGYYRSIANVIKNEPHISVDDGADLVGILHKMKRGEQAPELDIVKKVLGERIDWIDNVWAGAEETTTGVIRLRAMAADGAMLYPILGTNDTPTKWDYDNYIGTGQSTIDGVLRATADLLAGKVFVVAGYGRCGRGIAMRAKGMGARRVIIVEVKPHKVLTAALEGMDVMPIKEAAKVGDIFVTATGCKNVIAREHMELMKDGAVLANSGHFNVEIEIPALEEIAVEKKQIRPLVDQFTLKDGRRIFLLADGRLVNLAAAEGHPSEVMDMSFSDQALAVEWISKNKDDLKNRGGVVIDIPREIDDQVAQLKCEVMGLKYDVLTPEQDKYLKSWEEGT